VTSRFEPEESAFPAELAALERRFVLSSTAVEIGGQPVTLTRPRSADDLISEADFEKDERLPYWADVWPSSTALASRIAAADGRGRRALELGCGLGLVTIAALRAGYDVLATDYYEDALLFARYNGLTNAGREPDTRMVDWRHLPADLGAFDLVVASDVLYERAYATLVAETLVATLKPDGVALIADPGRVALLSFLGECEARGCVTSIHARSPWTDGSAHQTITIHEVRRSPAA
jgi:predicted nicotinamide N-methyase